MHGYPLVTIVLLVSMVLGLIDSSVLVADLSMTRMIELNAGAPFCDIYYDRGTIQRMVLGSDPKKVRQISNNLVADLEETCKVSQSKGKVSLAEKYKLLKLLIFFFNLDALNFFN